MARSAAWRAAARALLPAAAVATLVGSGCGRDLPPRPHNVILVSVDTLRADHLGVYGHPRQTSPALDAFAADAAVFERAYSHSPKTAPSHMSILTGLLPEVHGVRNWGSGGNERLSPEIPTLASILGGAGYVTRAFTEHGNVHPDLGFDQGFGNFRKADDVADGVEKTLQFVRRMVGRGPGAHPFFVFLHTYEVHDPYLPPEPYARRFVDPDYAGRIVSSERELLALAGSEWERQHQIYWSRVDPQSAADLRQVQDLYDAGIRRTDDALGVFFDELRELGVLGQTVVVVLSDHGEEFHEHGKFVHQSMYQEVLHVPLLMRFPGASGADLRGLRIPDVVRLVDVLPTLLDWIGVPAPAHVQGRSLLPLLEGQGPPPPERVLSEWPRKHELALRAGSLKLVRTPEGEELYDLASDPEEHRDLLEERPADAARLSEALDARLRESRRLGAAFGSRTDVELGEESRRQLELLGYLQPEPAPEPAPESDADPEAGSEAGSVRP